MQKNVTEKISLQEHLTELKRRIIFCVLFLSVAFCISYFFSTEIYQFLLRPLVESFGDQQNRRLIYTSPAEGFITFTKVAFYAALFFSLPIFTSQFYLFLAPALFKKEKKFVLAILFFAPFLFLCGAAFAFFFLLPLTFKFFLSFEAVGFAAPSITSSIIPIQLETKISEYLNLIIDLLFSFGVAFQLPILLLFLIRIGFLTVNDLRKRRKYAIVIIFIIAAILTPPDVLSQISLAIPMIFLFEIVILIGNKFNNLN